jgi:hypothetical protein
LRTRKCRFCREWFKPERDGQNTCCIECSIAYTKNSWQKQIKREKAKAKKDFNDKDRSHLTKEAQKAFNAYIRKRDEKYGCISCGNKTRQIHAGHYRPVGRNSALRFDPRNCHAQCSICNNHLSGNLNAYRVNLIDRIGKDAVLALEANNEPKKWTLEELRAIIIGYKQKLKELNE